VPGVREAIHGSAKYDSGSLEKPCRDNRKDLGVAGLRGGCCGSFATDALEEGFGVLEITIRTGRCRRGRQGKKLHARYMVELDRIHGQLDERWAKIQDGGQAMWLWVATDVKTKRGPVFRVGGRSQAMAYAVVPERKGRLSAGWVPVFRTDGLRSYVSALTAHLGKWEEASRGAVERVRR
jgi:transposase-like protein